MDFLNRLSGQGFLQTRERALSHFTGAGTFFRESVLFSGFSSLIPTILIEVMGVSPKNPKLKG
jgi:hypothetical protein